MCSSAVIKYMPKGREEIIMEMQNVKNQVKSVFTPARLKKAAAFAVLVGIVSVGGAYYHHQQAEARSAQEKEARSAMIAAQASQRNVVLIDEAHVRAIAAEAIGKSESELNFRTVQLTMKDHDDRDGKRGRRHEKGKDCREHREERREHDRDDRNGMMPLPPAQNAPANGPAAQGTPAPAPMEGAAQPAAAPAPMTAQPDFHPVYKVKCFAGNVEYKLRIDAVTGTVLSSKVDVDDDIF